MTHQRLDSRRLTRLTDWMQRYVDAGRFPGASVSIAHRDDERFEYATGYADLQTQSPWQHDTRVRIFSMTKPIASLGLMMLYERALFHLDQPIGDFIPELAALPVLRTDAQSLDDIEDSRVSPTIHQLLTHTSGLTYSFNEDLVAAQYRARGVEFSPGSGGLETVISRLADIPLLCQPGTRWNYSISTDVIGRLIEVISGDSLADFLNNEIFQPLGMHDTGFSFEDADRVRMASLYAADNGGLKCAERSDNSSFHTARVTTFSAGGGLLSTLDDYQRFAQLLLRNGRIGDQHLVSPHTLQLMMSNHLPGDIASMGPATFSETPFSGIGFGLGGWVVLNPALARISALPGDFGWGGMANTVFWVDKVNELSCVFFTQLMPSSTYPNRRELRALVYQALV